MPQTLMDKPKKKSSKLLWLVPVFGLLFLLLGGAAFGLYVWQKNRACSRTNTNATVANTKINTNTAVVVETNTKPTPEEQTVAEQGDQTGETNTTRSIRPTRKKLSFRVRRPNRQEKLQLRQRPLP